MPYLSLHDGDSVRSCPACCGKAFDRPRFVGVDHPYFHCQACGTWVQHPPLRFQYEAEATVGNADEAGERDRAANDWLAKYLVETFAPNSVLDVGCRYPVLLDCLRNRGVNDVLGIDGCSRIEEYGQALGVPVINGDFLTHDFGERRFDLVVMVHLIEHFVPTPHQALRRARRLGDGLFLRTPDVSTSGITTHLRPECVEVHPHLFSGAALNAVLAQTDWLVRGRHLNDAGGQIDIAALRQDV